MKKIELEMFQTMFESGVNNLLSCQEEINNLNVFPVPDGDTGTNMGMTFTTGLHAATISKSKAIGEYVKEFASGSLMGARGNSGVISSQIIKGISVGLINAKKEVTIEEFVKIFKPAKEYAYESVQNPIEGTILTIVKDLDNDKLLSKPKFETVEALFKYITNKTLETTNNTPNLLPILKESNVVDSGAFGIFKFFEGMYLASKGESVAPVKQTTIIGTEQIMKADPKINIGYCTEFIMTLKNPNVAIYNVIKNYLNTQGDSIVLVKDNDILKIHIHTKEPGKVMKDIHKYGEFSKIKIENMTTQVTENPAHNDRKEKISIIAVANGDGLVEEFNELGVKSIIEGGQSMNPSISDFINITKEIDTEDIIILPNNSNIILAAEQAAKNLKDKGKKIHVLSSKTIPEGLAAMNNFSKDHSIKENIKIMKDAIKNTWSASITQSIKDTTINGLKIKNGDYISIVNKEIVLSGKNLEKIVKDTLKYIQDKNNDIELFTVFIGNETPKVMGNKIQQFVDDNLDAEVEVKQGGQSIYNFVIMAE